jgi:hypothetical protein
MADNEQVEERPKCDYPVSINPTNPKEPGRKACGSEENIFRVIYSDRADKPVCREHLPYEFGSAPVSDAAPWDYGKK